MDLVPGRDYPSRVPPWAWVTLGVLIVLVILVVWTLSRPKGGRPPIDMHSSCTNWLSAGTSVSSVLPECGGGDAPPHVVRGKITAFGPDGKACYAEMLTEVTITPGVVRRLVGRAFKACGFHPNAYVGEGAFTCSPPGSDTTLSCRQLVASGVVSTPKK